MGCWSVRGDSDWIYTGIFFEAAWKLCKIGSTAFEGGSLRSLKFENPLPLSVIDRHWRQTSLLFDEIAASLMIWPLILTLKVGCFQVFLAARMQGRLFFTWYRWFCCSLFFPPKGKSYWDSVFVSKWRLNFGGVEWTSFGEVKKGISGRLSSTTLWRSFGHMFIAVIAQGLGLLSNKEILNSWSFWSSQILSLNQASKVEDSQAPPGFITLNIAQLKRFSTLIGSLI